MPFLVWTTHNAFCEVIHALRGLLVDVDLLSFEIEGSLLQWRLMTRNLVLCPYVLGRRRSLIGSEGCERVVNEGQQIACTLSWLSNHMMVLTLFRVGPGEKGQNQSDWLTEFFQ